MDPRFEKYAKVLVRSGIDVQPGQTLVINSSVDCAPFTRLCVKEGYAAGAREVIVRWNDETVTRETYLHAADDVFDTVRPWFPLQLNTLARENAAFLSIGSSDPDAMKGVDHSRMVRHSIASGKAVEEFSRLQMTDKIQWCIGCIPNPAWAKKVFPELPPDEAVSRLWDAIYATVRVTADNDPIAEWKSHSQALKDRTKILTAYHFRSLHYTNSLGTDLTVELPEGHYWEGGSSVSAVGTEFIPNMPTEEIFTVPKRDGVNGKVVSSKPFCIGGEIIDRFAFTFENGKIVDIETADPKHRELLLKETTVDEGASYLGEVALVPCDSPISSMDILFFNTLYDENASCHLAFGASYPTVEGAADLSPEERLALGLNDSITHEDFMIGTPDLSITGLTPDGREVPVFVNGNFAF